MCGIVEANSARKYSGLFKTTCRILADVVSTNHSSIHKTLNSLVPEYLTVYAKANNSQKPSVYKINKFKTLHSFVQGSFIERTPFGELCDEKRLEETFISSFPDKESYRRFWDFT
jgi:hypothetical protein